jgi:lysophospholipase L1-like esterase
MMTLDRGINMKYNIDAKKAIANVGNLYRMKRLMKQAKAGEKVTLGFLGGSITQGSLSSTPQTCYAYLVFDWWQKKFPKTEFTYINAGIGGTTSQFGVARVQSDLLAYSPDFIIVEYSVNDDDNEHFLETYEGLVRKIYSDVNEPAMLIVNNVRYNDGGNAEDQHIKVGKAYEIPCVSMRRSIYPLVETGIINNRDITPDDLHPNDEGHELVADVITYFLEKVYQELDVKEVQVKEMRMPITANTYQNSNRYQNQSGNYVSNGFVEDTSKQETITQCFKNGWTADKNGASIVFEIEGNGIAIQYRKSVNKPTPIAVAILDDDTKNAITLDGNFDEDWGDCLYLQTLTEHNENKKHKVEIKISEVHEDDVVPFYLVSVIGNY